MYKLVFFVPVDACEKVKQAVFSAGAGSVGNYDQACWQILGQGQFRPRNGSAPCIGTQDQLTLVEEYRVETVMREADATAVVSALKQAHPYEEPAYEVIRLESV